MIPKIILSLGFVALASLSNGQDVPTKKLRFMPLGEQPIWKDKVAGGLRQGQKPPKGALPPADVSIMSGKSGVPFKLGLRAFSKTITISGETEGLLLREGEDPQAPAWLKSPMPSAPLSLGVLYRDPKTMSWNDPKMLLLKDDAASFPTGSIRFVNVSSKTVFFMFGAKGDTPLPEMTGVAPGKSAIAKLKVGKNVITVGYVAEGGARKMIWGNQINVLKNERVQCFFYKAQNPKANGPVRFKHFNEVTPN